MADQQTQEAFKNLAMKLVLSVKRLIAHQAKKDTLKDSDLESNIQVIFDVFNLKE